MKKIIALILLLFVTKAFSDVPAPGQLFNYLGTGTNPHLHLDLSKDNGPKWLPFSIDYQNKIAANIPYPDKSYDIAKDWSPWNVIDEQGNYYGAITLVRNAQTGHYDEQYVAAKEGYYLEGVHLTRNQGETYQLTVDKIHTAASTGPFPDAPLA